MNGAESSFGVQSQSSLKSQQARAYLIALALADIDINCNMSITIIMWDYLRYYNLQDTRLMIEPLDYLIDMFFNYKIDMLQFMSMSASANAIKYALAYWDFKLDQDYTPKDDYAPFILTQNYWNIKVQNYLEQDKRRNRDTSNNIKEADCAFYRKLFLSIGCHICKARFTSKNPPILDRINNDRGHFADNCLITFSKHDRFNPFVKEFMSQRIQDMVVSSLRFIRQ
ncbi:MAG: hypothetical protein EZS28_039444 [Streblomastix strix]|uniref:Uncharacterized protein n=1 Tax=Streblomastix strix TaxID=222440 RepID=A0A5J4U3V9_9EUKA|nr:MAG: hypothetical protein EZS28_039444 [Streblomastix strix]